jgi:molybdopterin converting factor subunit 1
MHVKVLYFGVLKDVFRCEGEMIELPDGARVADLLAVCRGKSAAAPWDSMAVAVNQEYARRGDSLQAGDEVALLPPVSGGCPPHGHHFLRGER